MERNWNKRLFLIGAVILAAALLLYWLFMVVDLSAYSEGAV